MNAFDKYIQEHKDEYYEQKKNEYIKFFQDLLRDKNIELDKKFSIDEMKDIVPLFKLDGAMGIHLKYDRELTGNELCKIFSDFKAIIDLAFFKEFGPDDFCVCCLCGKIIHDEETKSGIFQTYKDDECDNLIICHACRREKKIRISKGDFIHYYKKPEFQDFFNEEINCGIDYSDYLKSFERINSSDNKKLLDNLLLQLKNKNS